MNILFSFLILGFFASNIVSVPGQEFISCNGFVKSSAVINLSKVEIQLVTKQGALKDYIECAPNNGYYLLPVYDKGEYLLKVSGPSGWVFEPAEISLNVDGINDPCSQGKDINFNLKGFVVNGKVITVGANDGPAGVIISLFQNLEEKPLLKTTTSSDGSFSLTPVQPGKYSVTATHPRWYLSKDTVAVTVTDDAVTLKENFVLAGYKVSGQVTSDGEPISDVTFILLASKKSPKITAIGCETKNLANFPIPKNDLIPVCYTKSLLSGQFTFQAVPPGEYHIFSYYEGPGATKFDVQPTLLKLNVVKDSVNINTAFQVTGFSVEGKVVTKQNGKPIKDMKIQLNGKDAGVTKENGIFILESVNTGSHQLQIIDPSGTYLFETKEVKISPNSPVLPPFSPDKFRVCGKLIVSQNTAKESRTVTLSAGSQIVEEFETNAKSGEFCGFLPPGNYEAVVKLDQQEISSGVKFSPSEFKISVIDGPVNGINFSQLKAILKGTIKCQGKCPFIRVLLTSNNIPSLQRTVIAEDGQYKFDDLSLGDYILSVELNQLDWCWESSSVSVSITSEAATAPAFVQTGMKINIVASHDTDVTYTKLGGKTRGKPVKLSVKAGSSNFCLESAGDYEFLLGGCHRYAANSIEWKTGSGPLVIKALSHAVKVRAISNDKIDDLFMNIHHIQDGEVTKKTRIGPLEAEPPSPSGKLTYPAEFFLAPNEEVELVPESKFFIVSPSLLRIVGKDDCYPKLEPFIAERGVILTGLINPPLPGVSVVFKDDGSNVINKLVTKTDGRYQFGPIKAGLSYKITAEKEGYIISGPDNTGTFQARKLAEVAVSAVDKETKAPLQGVLISMSGNENYRSNGQTNSDGKLSFLSISPSEYYLRPIMKEYRFTPSSKMVSVSEGATASIVFSGERVAFSVFGNLVALNGEPEEGTVVEATGVGSPACTQLIEEATSEAKGAFRIRGLLPQCKYSVKVAKSSVENKHVAKTVPEKIFVQVKNSDIKGIQLTVLSPVSHTNIVAQITVNAPEHLRTLRARLYRGENAEKAVASVKLSDWKWSSYSLNRALITLPSVPMDGARYLLQLESTLSRNSHTFTLPSVSFSANDSFQLVKVVFNPEPRSSESEFNNKSFMVVSILALLAVAYYKQDLLLNFIVPLTAIKWTAKEQRMVVSDDNSSDVVIVEPVNVKRKIKPKKL